MHPVKGASIYDKEREKMEKVNARKAALEVLIDIEKNNAFSNIAIQRYLRNKSIEDRDRRFITELVYGVTENKIYLDYIVDRLSKIKRSKIKVETLSILRMGLYQIIFLDKVPTSAAVNESVKLVKKVDFGAAGYVNAILRNYLRNPVRIDLDKEKMDQAEYLSIKYSHPKWMVERWLKDFGKDFTEELLQANNNTPPLTVRANTLLTTPETLLENFQKEGIGARVGLYVSEAIQLEQSVNLERQTSFQKGLFQVQDESSMLVSHVLDPKPGEFVMDLCAAPGGKTTHIAQLMQNRGRILAWDIYEHKLKLVRDAASRLGIEIIETMCVNALELKASFFGKADRVLVDVPCSGLGIIRKKPEIKYNKSLEVLNEITALQLKILSNGSKYVKKEGSLVYSTCSIERDENVGVMEKFLEQNSDFKLADINEFLPEKIRSEAPYLQLYPHIHHIDGFFICKFVRI
ncbi:MAG: 16S rRNA (cytosine(967)-C(5))-methyltransferase RsmB [Thermotaleaceae bacterium]